MIKLTAALKAVGGATDLFDAPWYLIDALTAASDILGLLSMHDEWAPPIEILHHPERLKEHFDAIKRNSGSGGRSDIEHDPTVDVSAAAEYRRKNGLPPV